VPASMFGAAQKKMLAGVGVHDIQVVAEATEFGPVRDLVLEGIGLGCSLAASVEADVVSGDLALIDIDAPPLLGDVRLVFNSRRQHAEPVQALVQYLRRAGAGWP